MINTLIKGVLFDFDGTLTAGGVLDFLEIRKAVGCPADTPVLEYITALSDENERRKAQKVLEEYERKGSLDSSPNQGSLELLEFLRERKIPCGIITRNSRASVEAAFSRFPDGLMGYFSIIISRDDEIEIKPSKAGIIHAAAHMKVESSELAVIGDYLFDIQAGHAAGSLTIFLDEGKNAAAAGNSDARLKSRELADYTAAGMDEVQEILDMHIPLSAGKVPNRLLKKILKHTVAEAPSLISGPGVGRDTAVVKADAELLVLKSDPVTFVTNKIASYALRVNANDIACSGAKAGWFLMTLLLPAGVNGAGILSIIEEFSLTARKEGIILCGGHTEITDAVTRPVISGTLIAAVEESSLIRPENMSKGDLVFMTKSAGFEGTAVIAGEFPEMLMENGMTEEEVQKAAAFADEISIAPEAQAAVKTGAVTAMHDVTEGGIAAALYELSVAGKRRLQLDLQRITIHPMTEKVCKAAGLDPLGLIGSGCLLLTCREDGGGSLERAFRERGISYAIIGKVMGEGADLDVRKAGEPAEMPEFETDEITRLYSAT
jgi:hydrogenase maturation factor